MPASVLLSGESVARGLRKNCLPPYFDRAYPILARTRDRNLAAFLDGARAGASPARLVLAPALRISGRVAVPPAATGFEVHVSVTQIDGPVSERTKVDPRGEYAVDGLPSGRYRVEARSSGGDGWLNAAGFVDAGGTLDLALK